MRSLTSPRTSASAEGRRASLLAPLATRVRAREKVQSLLMCEAAWEGMMVFLRTLRRRRHSLGSFGTTRRRGPTLLPLVRADSVPEFTARASVT